MEPAEKSQKGRHRRHSANYAAFAWVGASLAILCADWRVAHLVIYADDVDIDGRL